MTTLAYLATPYSKYMGGDLERAFIDAARLAARLLAVGVHCYSPIVHMHPIAIHGGLDPLDYGIWLPFDEMMMASCDTLIVAQMDGWDQSVGIAHEITLFKKAKKPVFDLNIETLTMTRRAT